MILLRTILALLLLSCMVQSQEEVETFTLEIGGKNVTQHVYSYSQQKLDHFSSDDNRIWNQRYSVYNSDFNPTNGTVFIIIGGISAQKGISKKGEWMIQLAQRFSAMIIVVEHRFYGVSQPFGKDQNSYSRENLQYLTIEQVLEDLAQIIQTFKQDRLHGISETNPFITIGGSYAGGLSAWFRSKYPHLTAGALASSPVINAIEDFQEMDAQDYISLLRSGEWCAKNVQNFNTRIEMALDTRNPARETIRGLFKLSSHTPDLDFLRSIVSLQSNMIQWGQREKMCNEFFPQNSKFSDQLKKMIQYFIEQEQVDFNYSDYDTLTNTTYSEKSQMRQWTWQTCSQLGLFNTAKIQPRGIRSLPFDVNYFRKECREYFGIENTTENCQSTNTRYHSTNIQATNLVITNGIEDKWRLASLLESTPTIESIMIDCDNCSNCSDLANPKETDSPILQQTRARVTELFNQWITEHQNQRQDSIIKRILHRKD